ncbi:hypothetical protein [Thomasclavelia sp.]
MDRNEIIKCYCIKDSVFTKYIKARIIDDKNDYTNEDIREISLTLSFEEIGFELKNIAFYLSLYKNKSQNKQQLLSILTQQRETLLNNIHIQEKKICTIDYYIYNLRRKN